MAKNKASMTVVSGKTLGNLIDLQQSTQEALNKITASMQASADKKQSDTQQQLVDLTQKILDTQRDQFKLAKKQQNALTKAFDDSSKQMKTWKTIGDRLGDMRRTLTDTFSAASMKKSLMGAFNFGGILNKKMQKVDFDDRQKMYGTAGAKNASYDKAYNVKKRYDDTNAALERVKAKAGLGKDATVEQIQAIPQGAELLKKKQRLQGVYYRYDPAAKKADTAKAGIDKTPNGSAPLIRSQTSGTDVTPSSSTHLANVSSSKEDQLESNRQLSMQTDLLQQIASNTAILAGKSSSAAGGAEDVSVGGGGRQLNGISGAIRGIGDSISGLGQGVGKGVGALIGGVFTGIMQGIADGIAALGTMKVVKGVAVIGLLSGVIWAMTNVLDDFSELDWDNIGKGLLMLGGVIAVTAAMGKGIGVMLKGAVALTAIGGGLWVLGQAFQAVGEAFNSFVDGIERLSAIGFSGLTDTAAGIGALALAISAFGAGTAAAGLGTLIGNLLTFGQDSPLEQLQKLADMGDNLMKAAQGVDAIGQAMKGFSGVDKDSMKAINEFPWTKATIFAAAGGAMSVNGAKVYNASKTNADEQARVDGVRQQSQPVASVNSNINNNTVQNQVVRQGPRNSESSQERYISSRY